MVGAIREKKTQYNEESSNINLTCSAVSIIMEQTTTVNGVPTCLPIHGGGWWRRSYMVHNVKFKNTYGDALL